MVGVEVIGSHVLEQKLWIKWICVTYVRDPTVCMYVTLHVVCMYVALHVVCMYVALHVVCMYVPLHVVCMYVALHVVCLYVSLQCVCTLSYSDKVFPVYRWSLCTSCPCVYKLIVFKDRFYSS